MGTHRDHEVLQEARAVPELLGRKTHAAALRKRGRRARGRRGRHSGRHSGRRRATQSADETALRPGGRTAPGAWPRGGHATTRSRAGPRSR